MSKRERHGHGFPPLFDENSEILILGSFPSVKSREAAFFYGHKQNRFWKMVYAVYGEEFTEDIPARRGFCLRHHLAMYDSIESCSIIGSSDATIEDVEPADLERIYLRAPIKRILLNGKKSASVFERYQKVPPKIEVVVLPSTSPANAAVSLEKLIEKWAPYLK